MQHVSRRINIAYVIDNYTPGAGTENQLITLIDGLDRRRYQPYVVNLRSREDGVIYADNCEVMFLGLDSRVWSPAGIRAVVRLARFIREHRVDIVQSFFYESRLVATLAAMLVRRGRLVFCKRNARREHQWICRLLAARSHYCLSNTRCACRIVSECERFDSARIHVIYNGVSLPKDNSGQLTSESLSIPPDAPVVGMVANYRRIKRIDRLLQVVATSRHKTMHCLVVGRGQREEELRQQAQELGIAERVRFFHTIGGIRDVLEMMSVGLFTSESEGLSNALIEYALAARPAVAFDVGGNNEIVVHGLTGYLVRDGDIQQMAAYLDKLLDNHVLRRRLGDNALAMARDRFSVEAMVRQTQAFYDEILAEDPAINEP
jgi:glycosyltransferase involved in cell wall biosynthesis